jgi:uncharacterized protein (DUF58 family)
VAALTGHRHVAFQRRRSLRLTGRGRFFFVAAVGLVVLAYSAKSGALLLIAIVVGSVFLAGVGIAMFYPVHLTVKRHLSPSPVSVDTDTAVTVTITNDSSWRTPPSYWSDTIPWRPLATVPSPLVSLAGKRPRRAGGRTVHHYQIDPPRRGAFEVGPLLVALSDPFGIAVSFIVMRGREEILVTPKVVDLRETGLWLEAPDGTASLVQANAIGNADDLITREYRPGDALRRVHWKSTARRGDLMVRQEEQRAYPEASIVIDTRLGGYPDVIPASPPEPAMSDTFDWAVTMLASLGVHLHRAGFSVNVVETADPQAVSLSTANRRSARHDDFLLSLALISLVDDDGSVPRPRVGAAEGPVFALVATPDIDTLDWLVRLRRPTELGVVFVIGDYQEAAPVLASAGWTVVPVHESTSHDFAWTVLAETLGTVHAGA